MGAWSIYFLAKLGLYAGAGVQLHWMANLAFAITLCLPIESRRLRIARQLLAVPLALWLAALDLSPTGSVNLPGLLAAATQFRARYLLELAGRLPLLRFALGLGVLLLAWWLLRERLRFATLVILGLLAVPLLPAPGAAARAAAASYAAESAARLSDPAVLPDAALEDFLERERGRRVFPARAGRASFDLVIISVCSLSQDDLEASRLQDTPLLAGFDIVFRQFNSASTYSGPAVLRLLHATCGQPSQGELYATAPPRECLLFPALEDAGYAAGVLLNHDGRFDDFAAQLHRYGGLSSDPAPDREAAVQLTAFDGSPVRSDFDVLHRWLQARAGHPAPAALLYNTITLHDGNTEPGVPDGSARSYAPRLTRLLSDLDRFLRELEQSHRPTVVVIVPEHGAAIRGDAMQVTGLRELPTRAITRVPVAVKLIGFASAADSPPRAGPILVDRPSSYLALSTLVAGLLQLGPGGVNGESLAQLVDALPATAWVAENEGTILLGRAAGDQLRTPRGQWMPVARQ